MQAQRIRLHLEKMDLDRRIDELIVYTDCTLFIGLDDIEQMLIKRQLMHMQQYSACLDARIRQIR
jgi:hypothetical protein